MLGGSMTTQHVFLCLCAGVVSWLYEFNFAGGTTFFGTAYPPSGVSGGVGRCPPHGYVPASTWSSFNLQLWLSEIRSRLTCWTTVGAIRAPSWYMCSPAAHVFQASSGFRGLTR